MISFEQALAARLEELRQRSLYRELKRLDSPQSPRTEWNGRTLLNFSSNDYLGLTNDPDVKAAAEKAVREFGAGSGASRLICGSLAPHHELEECLATFKGVPAALTFGSGFAAALGAIGALMGKGDYVVLDRLAHASLVDAAKLSGATLRVFRHNDPAHLDHVLAQLTTGRTAAKTQVLVVTESVFSMDGDRAPLNELADVKDKHGAWLMVDEAHGTGLYGQAQRGVAEEAGVSGRIEVHMGTLGKALAASGGFICGSEKLIQLLVNRARSFIFSTAPVPAATAAARAAVEKIASGECRTRLQRLWRHVESVRNELGTKQPFPCPILPLHVGDEARALELGRALLERGFLVPAVRYPAVGRGKARLRLTLTAAHDDEDVERLLAELRSLGLLNS